MRSPWSFTAEIPITVVHASFITTPLAKPLLCVIMPSEDSDTGVPVDGAPGSPLPPEDPLPPEEPLTGADVLAEFVVVPPVEIGDVPGKSHILIEPLDAANLFFPNHSAV